MHVVISSTFARALHEPFDALVRRGFADVESDDVEVHVKARSRTRRMYVAEVVHEGRLVRAAYSKKADAEVVASHYRGTWQSEVRPNPRAGGWSARTYDGIPSISRVEPGMRYLVTMMIPADPRRLRRYPVTHRYPGLKTAPLVTFRSWEEELFFLSAHEARHVHQFRHGLRRSEIDAERWAQARLTEASLV